MYWTIVGILVIILIVALAIKFGVFKIVQFKEETLPKMFVAAKLHVGPFKTVALAFEAVSMGLDQMKIPMSQQGIGIFPDDPETTPEDKLRSLAGFIIPESVATDEKTRKALSETDIHIIEYPATTANVAEFPLVNTISYMLGAYKVYPKAKAKKLVKTAAVEIYDLETSKIRYAFPTENLEVFSKMPSSSSSSSSSSSTDSKKMD